MERLKNQKYGWFPEATVFVLFLVLFGIISAYHEPWYDEAEAWQIARCANLHDILFYLPHYEGHPPLWHLLLAIPAKLGVPYEWGLKTTAGIFTVASVGLILFRSPFPRIVRVLLPFNYFVFYQYGVVSRPYGMMLFAFLLAAMAFKGKEQHPWRFVAALYFLCLTSTYGIVLAGGIASAWVVDILRHTKWNSVKDFVTDKRVHALTGLLVGALALLAIVMPYADTVGTNLKGTNTFWERLLYTFFGMLPDATLVSILGGEVFLNYTGFSRSSLLCGLLLVIAMLLLFYCISSKNLYKYYIIPYCLFAVFAAMVYFNAHHIGLIVWFTLFWLWVAFEREDSFSHWKNLCGKQAISQRDQQALKKLASLLVAACILIPTYWTASASVHEIGHEYEASRAIATFLKEYHLDEKRIIASWGQNEIDDNDEVLSNPYARHSVFVMNHAIDAFPYFEHNLFLNLNRGRDDMAYVLHKSSDVKTVQAEMQNWKEQGIPDVMIGQPDLRLVYGDVVHPADYVPVFEINPSLANIWKDFIISEDYEIDYIYLRKDLLEEHGLKQLDVELCFYPYQ